MKIENFKLKVCLLLLLLLNTTALEAQNYTDAALAAVRKQDAASRDAKGKLPVLSAAEHGYRAEVYFSNRAFAEAREHASKILENYPNDTAMPHALFVLGRSFMWEKQYELAVTFFDDAAKKYPNTKDGREALAFKGASLVRLGKSLEAARAYEQYVSLYPNGERIESSYLNVIDAYREAGKPDSASVWVAKTRQRFPGTATETNAVFARLRMEIGRKNWNDALSLTEEMRSLRFPKGSMASLDETMFLRAFVLEKLGKKDEAINTYFLIPDNANSYFGWQATERLQNLIDDSRRADLSARQARVRSSAQSVSNQFPVMYREDLLRSASPRRVDPRLVLAIMKQESSFRPNAKSPAAARGLLQMTVDTAGKYQMQAGYTALAPEDLYRPSVSIALGSIYIAELQKEFSNLPEAVAAAYNGGEDNSARWLKRAGAKEPFLFASEVGFAETKDYVFKVLSNYRVYRELYAEDLKRR